MLPYYPWLMYYPFYTSSSLFYDTTVAKAEQKSDQNQPINNNTVKCGKKTIEYYLGLISKEDLIQDQQETKKRTWSEQQDNKLKEYVEEKGLTWDQISALIPGRNPKMCYSRYRRLSNQKKFYWKKEDNHQILKLIKIFGYSWKDISHHFTKRNAKQIREHYFHFLRPDIQKKDWSVQQDLKLLKLIQEQGRKWKKFQSQFKGRTENQIKNRFYGKLMSLAQKKKKLKKLST